MKKNYASYRVEGTAALKESTFDHGSVQACIVSFESARAHADRPAARTSKLSLIEHAISSDPLLGSISSASAHKAALNYKDRSLFIVGSTLMSIFGLIVVLIGA